MSVLRDTAERLHAPLCQPGKDNEFSYRFESSRPVGPAYAFVADHLA
jgi:hypothetical protein